MKDDGAIVGIVGTLGMLVMWFIALKITNNIDWSWWWVLAPIAIICLIMSKEGE